MAGVSASLPMASRFHRGTRSTAQSLVSAGNQALAATTVGAPLAQGSGIPILYPVPVLYLGA